MGRITAGIDPDALEVLPGQCAYITTGAKLPRGADAVVKVKKTERAVLTASFHHEQARVCCRFGPFPSVFFAEITSVQATSIARCLFRSSGQAVRRGRPLACSEGAAIHTEGNFHPKCVLCFARRRGKPCDHCARAWGDRSRVHVALPSRSPSIPAATRWRILRPWTRRTRQPSALGRNRCAS